MRQADDEDEDEDSGRQTRALAALAVVLAIAVVGFLLVQYLKHASDVQDCLLAHRTNCDAVYDGGR